MRTFQPLAASVFFLKPCGAWSVEACYRNYQNTQGNSVSLAKRSRRLSPSRCLYLPIGPRHPLGIAIRLLFAGLAVALVSGVRPAKAEPLPVQIENRSEPTLCAEEDNVAVAFTGRGVRGLTISAQHPAYIGTLDVDVTAPDFSFCDMSDDHAFPAEPRREVLYDDGNVRLVGIAYQSFWRPADVPVTVAGRKFEGLHLLQVHVRPDGEPAGPLDETLVLYPPDGYWRLRPIEPEHLDGTAYGSSFLAGPVTEEGRPMIDILNVEFDPGSRSFRLRFTEGGHGTVKLAVASREVSRVEITFDPPVPDAQPFAMLRSMHVSATNNDVGAIAWVPPDGLAWREETIMEFERAQGSIVWTGRTTPSRHNTSAPDITFSRFEDGEG